MKPIFPLLFVFASLACDRGGDHKSVRAESQQICGLVSRPEMSHAHWIVLKKETVPVVGLHPVRATASPFASFADLRMTVDFSPDLLQSYIPLRDERIKGIFFGAFPSLRFTLAAMNSEQALPTPGNTVPVSMAGVLEIASQKLNLAFTALFTATDRGFYLSAPNERITFNMREQWGLGDKIDELSELAGVKIDDNISIHFELLLEDSCGV